MIAPVVNAIERAPSPAAASGETDPVSVRAYLMELQSRIVAELEARDSKRFLTDSWQKASGESLSGDGVTRILENGDFFERAGVGFSHVAGNSMPPSATQSRPELAGRGFEAMGLSLVLHPRSPYVPTVHMNVRFFIATPSQNSGAGRASPLWWVGGGMDLTPCYGFVEDAVHFHASCKKALAPFGAALYPRFKKWCDEYFYLKHRGETRGVGGVFFDDFSEPGFDESFSMLRSVGNSFADAYLPIADRRKGLPYGAREREWQAYRRGRYVEFNLVFDRGTHFGLHSGGRTESILMSLPPLAAWRYAYEPEPGSPEAELGERFLVPREWL